MGDRWCILDDYFPNLLTTFRVAEYHAYLAASPELTIFSSSPRLEKIMPHYAAFYPKFAHRIKPYSRAALSDQRFAYTVFLENAHEYLSDLEHHRIPFAFTLYPGGNFGVDEPESDAKLRAVTSSELLRGVVTTQNLTERYLAQKAPHVPRQFVFGVVMHPFYFTPQHEAEAAERPRYGSGKPYLDLCFVAHKYIAGGANKGWPTFAGALPKLLAHPQIRAHVIGGFSAADYSGPPLPEDRVVFHGSALTGDLRRLLLTMDAIVSPNEPFKIRDGYFDGFPTGCCVEASLCGAAMVVSDVLGMNPAYRDGEDIVLIEPDVGALVEKVLALAERPDTFAAIGEAGRQASRQMFHPALQVGVRAAFLSTAAERVGVDLGLMS